MSPKKPTAQVSGTTKMPNEPQPVTKTFSTFPLHPRFLLYSIQLKYSSLADLPFKPLANAKCSRRWVLGPPTAASFSFG